MDDKLREYNRQWRLANKEAVARANKAYRANHPDYAKQWLAAHPNYQSEWRQKNPMWRKLWYQRYKSRDPERQAAAKLWAEQISHGKGKRPIVGSLIQPTVVEYANWTDLPTKLQSLLALTGCKYLINDEFCNQPKQPGKPYCLIHSLKCYLPVNHTGNLNQCFKHVDDWRQV